MEDKTIEELRFIAKDAKQAAESLKDVDGDKANRYMDEALEAGNEINRRVIK